MSSQEEIAKLKERIAFLEGKIEGLTHQKSFYTPPAGTNTFPTWGGLTSIPCGSK